MTKHKETRTHKKNQNKHKHRFTRKRGGATAEQKFAESQRLYMNLFGIIQDDIATELITMLGQEVYLNIINGEDSHGDFALLVAAKEGSLRSISILLEAGADPKKQHVATKKTALMVAKNPETIRLLLDAVKPSTDIAALFKTVNFRKTENLLKQYEKAQKEALETYINMRDSDGYTALTHALEDTSPNSLPNMKVLISNGADLFVVEKLFGNSLLHIAVTQNNIEKVKLILSAALEKEFDELKNLDYSEYANEVQDIKQRVSGFLNYKNKKLGVVGESAAIHLAASIGNTDIVKLLLQYGANVFIKDASKLNAFQYADFKNHTALAAMLKDIMTESKKSNTAKTAVLQKYGILGSNNNTSTTSSTTSSIIGAGAGE